MGGRCRDSDVIVIIPDEYRFVAAIYDYQDWEEGDPIPIREVEEINYMTGSIWYSGGFRSTNYRLIPKSDSIQQGS